MGDVIKKKCLDLIIVTNFKIKDAGFINLN